MSNKKTSYLSIILVLIASSCTQLEDTPFQEESTFMKKITVEATWGDTPETKTALQPNGSILWSPGDEINLFYGSMTGSKFTTTISVPAASASFEGTLGAATGSSEQGVATQTFWGVYPYDEANTCDGTGVTLSIKGAQTVRPGSFGEGMNPSVANSPGLSLSFYNVGSWLVFSVTEPGITSAVFAGNNGEAVAGKVYVTMDSSGKPTSQVVDGGGLKSISITPAGGGEFIPGVDYYVTIIPQILTNGYSFTMFKGDKMAKRSVTSPRPFDRSAHVSGREIDKGLTWQSICVDMGDGVKWATMNMGAPSPEEYGEYFGWAETAPKTGFSWAGYKWGSYSTDMTKYVTHEGQGRNGFLDNKSVLEPEDDAATANWGGDWRMPTEEEWLWLKNNCTWTQNADGYLVTSNINGNQIILPEAGYKSNMQYFSGSGVYWSATLDGTYSSQARAFFFSGSNQNTTNGERYCGYSVRPVKGFSNASMYVELGPGVKWAKMNIGARSPEDYGNYYAWGEIHPKNEYTDANYAFGTGSTLTKYVTNSDFGTPDGLTTLLPEDDVATVQWGGDWRIPTSDEWSWLHSNTTCEATTVNGVSGVKLTSTVQGYKGNSIFIPNAGHYWGSMLVNEGSRASSWSSSVYEWDDCRLAYLSSAENHSAWWEIRSTGVPVRAVYMPRVPLTSFSISDESIVVGVELKKRLYTQYSPSNATEHGAIWTSSNPSVARVSGSGEVTGVSPGSATITAVSTDGHISSSCIVQVIESYVDMGGGMEWATFNVGADSPEENGDFFAWGEPWPRSSYSWDTYPLGSQNNCWIYNGEDGLVQLLPDYDAATAQMGGPWHIPSEEEWTWLRNNCTWSWKGTGIKGYTVTSNETGKSIFLPAAGFKYLEQHRLEGNTGLYWSSSVHRTDFNNAYALFFQSSEIKSSDPENRFIGGSIRAVRRKWVDMGDGLKWATTNVGGSKPEDYGDYFAWGEILPKESYDWENYKWGTSSTSLTAYVTDSAYGTVDNQTTLLTADDAARANWGATWRMPTYNEWIALLDKCTHEWTTVNGVYGRLLTSTVTGNTIFLPAAGYRLNVWTYIDNPAGHYWSSTLNPGHPDSAWDFSMDDPNGIWFNYTYRFIGLSVRPVSD